MVLRDFRPFLQNARNVSLPRFWEKFTSIGLRNNKNIVLEINIKYLEVEVEQEEDMVITWDVPKVASTSNPILVSRSIPLLIE